MIAKADVRRVQEWMGHGHADDDALPALRAGLKTSLWSPRRFALTLRLRVRLSWPEPKTSQDVLDFVKKSRKTSLGRLGRQHQVRTVFVSLTCEGGKTSQGCRAHCRVASAQTEARRL